MKTITKTIASLTITATIAMALASNAHSAGYLKIGDIKGESKAHASSPEKGSIAQGTQSAQGLLLPAVQKAREAARKSPKKEIKGTDREKTAGDEHEVEYDLAAGV